MQSYMSISKDTLLRQPVVFHKSLNIPQSCLDASCYSWLLSGKCPDE